MLLCWSLYKLAEPFLRVAADFVQTQPDPLDLTNQCRWLSCNEKKDSLCLTGTNLSPCQPQNENIVRPACSKDRRRGQSRPHSNAGGGPWNSRALSYRSCGRFGNNQFTTSWVPFFDDFKLTACNSLFFDLCDNASVGSVMVEAPNSPRVLPQSPGTC